MLYEMVSVLDMLNWNMNQNISSPEQIVVFETYVMHWQIILPFKLF